MPDRSHFRMLNDEEISALKRRNPTVDVVAIELGQAPTRRGSRLCFFGCPFHDDSDPSFVVYPDGHYHCFGCGAHGNDVFDFLRAVKGMNFHAACRHLGADTLPLAPHVGTLHLPKGVGAPKNTTPVLQDTLWRGRAEALVRACETELMLNSYAAVGMRSYLAGRGLGMPLLQAHHIGCNPVATKVPGLGRVPRGIIIPARSLHTDQLSSVTLRLLPTGQGGQRYQHISGSLSAPLGFDTIVGRSHIFVLEGQFDYLLVRQTLEQMGLCDAGAITYGSATSHPDPDDTLYLLGPQRYLIATDADTAGERSAAWWLQQTTRAVRYAPNILTPGDKDVTDMWVSGGSAAVERWIAKGLELPL
ncbi:MAG: CHC2 zinc finger domain-containing protein [Chloroflexota bacterium]